jgi:DMSO/TMAO reductase YedYZ molybdopterin-dependent catalytic subunit/mono/diheme cytochrome c family protein
MPKVVKRVAFLCALSLMFGVFAFAESLPQEDLNERTSWEKNAEANVKYAPEVRELKNGVRVQRTPYNKRALDTQAGDVEAKTITSWNNYFLNADKRGCTACHTIEDALEMMETYHGIVYFGYNNEQGIQNCFGCHSFYDNNMRSAIHTLHQRSKGFQALGGNCESCHYINRKEDGTIEYQRWDYVKYDILKGIEDVAAEDINADFEWNQTEITPHEKMYFKSIKSDPKTWTNKDEMIPEDIRDTWTVKFTGEVKEEKEYTINELIEKFGTEKRLMKSHCVVNGPGQGMIYQAEVEGIPMSRIIEDIKPNENARIVYPTAADGYCYPISVDVMNRAEAILVVNLNGDPIYADQGAPIAFWLNELSAGNNIKEVIEVKFSSEGSSWDFYGDFTDATTGLQFDKPNVGVLNAMDGQIFNFGEPVHLEGYADAWNEPIRKIEFSFDHGDTWKAYEIENADTVRWVYWKLDINDIPVKGSYLVKIRVSSEKADGSMRTNDVPYQMTNFMFNVQ